MQRFERWVLSILGTFVLGTLVYAISFQKREPPIRGIGEPVRVVNARGNARFIYEIDGTYAENIPNLDVQLQIVGFTRQGPYSFQGFYRRQKSETIRILNGSYVEVGSGRFRMNPSSRKTTIVHWVHERSWGRSWHETVQAFQRSRAVKGQVGAPISIAPTVYPVSAPTNFTPPSR